MLLKASSCCGLALYLSGIRAILLSTLCEQGPHDLEHRHGYGTP